MFIKDKLLYSSALKLSFVMHLHTFTMHKYTNTITNTNKNSLLSFNLNPMKNVREQQNHYFQFQALAAGKQNFE